MKFEVVGVIEQAETIAAGLNVKVRGVLRKIYGRGRWRKMKGVAQRDMKIKSYVDKP